MQISQAATTVSSDLYPDSGAHVRSDRRPAKVARTQDHSFRGESTSAHIHGADQVSVTTNRSASEITPRVTREAPRTRGLTACQTCRSRKTKCDNQRPSCRYCIKTGETCVYLEVEQMGNCHLVGPQLLEAISSLTELLQRQQNQQLYVQRYDAFSPASLPFVHSGFSPQDSVDDSLNYQGASYLSHHRRDLEVQSLTSRKRRWTNDGEGQRTISHEGLESVLKWNVFPQQHLHSNLLVDGDIDVSTAFPVPKFNFTEMTRLKSRYIEAVHVKNPILDLHKLNEMMFEVAENGPDWSTKTCLVSLVCALAAFSQSYPGGQPHDHISPLNENSYDFILGDDPELAMQYWGVAVKRLGFALEQNTLEAVQCLCLTGVWYMQNLRPLQAWKYFSFAGNAWYSATLRRQPTIKDSLDGGTSETALTLEQSLYFTTYKSECELLVELSIPGSILEDVDLSCDFPLPPNIPDHLTDTESQDTERGWYYYLAEIASRHLINRMLRARTRIPNRPSAGEISRMFSELEVYESQTDQWFSSLPPRIAFPRPQGSALSYIPDELTNILRSRYCIIRELNYRPFVRLCLTSRLDVSPDMISRVVSIAQEGLRYCMYRIQSASPQRHHGQWLGIRNFISCSLILIGTDRARGNPALNAASRLQLPEGWREQILRQRDRLSACLNFRRGGLYECSQILDWALAGCPAQSLDH